MKNNWQTPSLETLDVSKTMAGTGVHYVDWTFVGGKPVINTTDDNTGYPAPPLPSHS